MTTRIRIRNARRLCAVGAVVLLVGLLVGLAPAPASAQGNSGRVSVSTGIDISTAYYFRGILQRRDGAIFQPYSDVSFDIYQSDQAGVSFTLGQWNSIHTTTHQHHHVPNWYESDFYTGFGFGVGSFEAGVTYTMYASPSHAFGTTHEIAVNAGFDDSAWLGGAALYPYATLVVEAAGGADGGGAEGRYLELGIEPGVDIGGDVARFSVPVSVGLSLSDYYENGLAMSQPGYMSDTFGFVGVGAMLTVGLPTAESFGSWELTAGVQLLRLGEFLEATNNGDQNQAIGVLGISVSY